MKVVVEEAVVALEVEVEAAVEAVVEDKKRTRKRITNRSHTAEAEVEEEEHQVSTMFNVILAKSMVIMQRSVITMKRKMMRKKISSLNLTVLKIVSFVSLRCRHNLLAFLSQKMAISCSS